MKKDKKIIQVLENILFTILPNLNAKKANGAIKDKPDDNVDLKEVSIDAIKEKYEETTFAKSQLDDKAKTTTAALTITITLVLNLYGLVKGAMEKGDAIYFEIIVFVLAVISVLYIATAWFLAMSVLFKHNTIYRTSLDDRSMAAYYRCIVENGKINLIRNNCLYASYLCIRNSVVCLILVFVLATCPCFFKERPIKIENITYSENLREWVKENPDEKKSIEILINNSLDVFKKKQSATIYVKEEDTELVLELEGDECIVRKVD